MGDISWSKGTSFNRPYAKKTGCTNCKKQFEINEEFVIKETKQSWFRGDDKVEFLCYDCSPEKYKKKLRRRSQP